MLKGEVRMCNIDLDFILKALGFAFIVLIFWLAIALMLEWIKEQISDWKWQYKRKHRFDKPPVAQCYCKDCIYYRVYDGFGKCGYGHIDENWNIADSWFCWKAEPLKIDPETIKELNPKNKNAEK